MALPLLAVTLGDPAGVGPEIVVKALAEPACHQAARLLVVGDSSAVGEAIRTVGIPLLAHAVDAVEEARFDPDTVDVLEVTAEQLSRVRMGEGSDASGSAAVTWLQHAVRMAQDRQVEAVVAGPVHGAHLHLGRSSFPAQGDLLAALTEAGVHAQLFISGPVRIAPVTPQVPLRDAAAGIDRSRVLTTIKLVRRALNDLGVREPRLGVAALNPVADREEAEAIAPAIEAALALGFDVEGPLPAPLLAARLVAGRYDAGVAMYADQAAIAALAREPALDELDRDVAVSGVEATLGLPIAAVSVAHGPAFDIAGQGIASSRALEEAIRVAAEFATQRRTAR